MPLHLAAIFGRADAAALLAQSGAPCFHAPFVAPQWVTAGSHTRSQSQPHAGASLKARTRSGRTALDLARQEKNKIVVQTLEFHESRMLSEGSPVDEDDEGIPAAPDPRVSLAAGLDPRTPYMISYGQEDALLPTLATAGAALLLPVLFYHFLRSWQKRASAGAPGARPRA